VREDSLIDYRNPGIALPVSDALTRLAQVVQGVRFKDGLQGEKTQKIAV